jgi:hypothetical protein
MAMNATYDRYLKDEGYRAAIVAAALRERAEAMRNLFVEPLLGLLQRPPLRQTRMLRRSGNR